MSETLYIRLGCEQADACQWLIWSSQENEVIASGDVRHAEQLNTLGNHAKSRKTVVFVPGQTVSLKQLALPAKAQRKLQQVVPYMLEEELAEDIDDCFFAYGEKQQNVQQIAIVNRNQMLKWLSWLDDADIKPSQMLPDVLAMPLFEDGWSCLTLADDVLCRQQKWQGFATEQSWFNHALQLALKEQDDEVKLHDHGALALSETGVDVINHTPELAMLVLAKHTSGFNMLQGEFKQTKEVNKNWVIWKPAAVLAGVTLIANLALNGAELISLNNQREALKQEINDTYKSAFPNTRRIVNVRSQLKRKLEELGGAASGTSVLTMLSQLQPAIANSKLSAESIKFDGKRGELRFQAVAAGFNQFEQFKEQAEAAGYNVQQGAINNQQGKVVGSFIIRGKS